METVDALRQEIVALQAQIRKLQEVQVLSQQILDTLPSIIVCSDMQGKILITNRAAEQLLGKPRHELIGQDQTIIFSSEHLAWWQHDVQYVLAHHDQCHHNVVIPTTDGSNHTYHIHLIPIMDEQGTMVATNTVLEDVTEQQDEHDELAHKVELFHNLVNTLPFAIFYKDIDGKYLGCNSIFAEDFFGKPVDEVVGKTIFDLLPHDPEKAQFYYHADRSLLQMGGIQIYEAPMRFANGQDHTIMVYKSIYYRPDGSPGGLIGAIINMTERRKTEEELRMFKTLVENATDAIGVATLDGVIVYANPAYCRMMGYADGELIGVSLVNTYNETPERLRELVALVANEGHWFGELPCLRKDGSTFPGMLAAFHIRDQHGNVQFIAGTIRDITEQKAAEEALRRSEARHRALLNAIPDMIFVQNRESVFLDFRASRNDLYVPPEHFLGKRNEDVFPPELATQFTEAIHMALDGNRVVTVEYTLPDNGVIRHFEGRLSPIDDDTVIVMVRDVTERKNSEQELRVFKTVIENAVDGIGMVDNDAKIIFMNSAYSKLCGYGQELLGMSLNVLYDIGMDQLQTMLRDIEAKGSWLGIMPLKHRSGETIPVQLSVFPVPDEDGKPRGTVAIVRDIREQIRAEEERSALQQRIIAVQRETLRELSSPLLPISNEIMVMPLIGSIDSGRAEQIMETLLVGVGTHKATLVLLDITGVQVVDTHVARMLVDTAQALRLLGVRVMLTGIRPQIAQTLVHLGVDLSGIITQGSLQEGIARALHLREQARR